MATPLAKRLTSDPVSKIELSIRCNNLLNKDFTSKSDPCCVVYLMTGTVWTEIGRTETIQNDLNPVFARIFQVDYFFEEVQKVRFLVYDIDNSTITLNDDDFLGSMECTLGEIVSNSPFSKPLILKGTRVAGKSTITVRAQETASSNEVLTLQFSAKNLDNMDFLGKSDPYLEFHRKSRQGGYVLVHRTEVIKNNLNPRWRAFEIKSSRLCKDPTDPIKVECYDYDDGSSNDFIGSFEATVEQLMQATNRVLEWPCINPKKKAKKKNYTNSGIVVLSSCIVRKEFSFLDFVLGGLQINFTVGVDFTASNGDPRDPRSLHFISPHQPNLYSRAILSVGEVIKDYDSDQMFPALGYGAKILATGEVSHCFALNFNPGNPFCAGIQGVLDAYRMCFSHVQLYGPTNFSPIIYHVAQFAEAAHRERAPKNYYVLLIITDGVISDMDDTVRAVVYASTLPMSIIIVGVGEAEFQAMDTLDGDNGMLRDSRGNCARRDIVQFVPFRNFLNASPAALAKQVLAEIPDQVSVYYRQNNIEPGKPRPMDAVVKQLEDLQASNPTSGSGGMYPNVSGSQPSSSVQPVSQGHHSNTQVPNQPGYPMGQQSQPLHQNVSPGAPPGRPGYTPGQPGSQNVPGGSAPGYPPGQPGATPGYLPGQQGPAPGYPTGQPGYSPGHQGYPTGQPGYPAGQPGATPGYPPGQPGATPGYLSGQQGPAPGYPTGQPGYSPGHQGYPTGQPGYPASQPGHPAGQPGYPTGQPGYPSPQMGYHPSNQPTGAYGHSMAQYGGQPGVSLGFQQYPMQYPQHGYRYP